MSSSLAMRLSKHQTEGLACRPVASGRLVRVVGLTLEAVGCRAPVDLVLTVALRVIPIGNRSTVCGINLRLGPRSGVTPGDSTGIGLGS